MPQDAWSPKRERQYEHIKEGLLERGSNEDKAAEIAARTVNKERARTGEAKQSSRLSRTDMSSGRRGGKRSGTSGPGAADWPPVACAARSALWGCTHRWRSTERWTQSGCTAKSVMKVATGTLSFPC